MKLEDMIVRVEYDAALYYAAMNTPYMGVCGDQYEKMKNRLEYVIRQNSDQYECIGLLDGRNIDTNEDGLIFISSSGDHVSHSANSDFSGLLYPHRIFLRKKKKYRYVSDGKQSRGKEGQYTFLQDGTICEYKEPKEFFYERFWFDREEVKE